MHRSPLTPLDPTALLRTVRGPDAARWRRRRVGRRLAAAGTVPVLAAAAAVAVLAGQFAAGQGATGQFAAGQFAAGQGAAPVRAAAVPLADATTTFTLDGHGHGHGRGMGQWGAYGYAVDQGWSARQIIEHFYGGTELTRLDPGPVSVRLMGLDGKDLAVTSSGPMTVGGRPVPAGQAVTLHPTPAGADVTVTQGCGGAPGETFATDAPRVSPADGGTLTVCGGDSYRGDLGVALDGGDARSVNYVGMDDYLRGVVPKEISAGWADKGAGEALKAQAIAARSYAAAQHRYAYADTCDTQACQVYAGTSAEDPRTDAAVAGTSGMTVTRGGQPVSTEFSASTGGWTAGGDFPAVEDAGDTASPDHDWTQQVLAQEVSDAFGVGPLREMTVSARNGLGADGGRVVTLHVVGADKTVDVTGEDARVKLGLKSDWFSIEGQDAPASVIPPAAVPGVPGGTAPDGEGPAGDPLGIVGAALTPANLQRAADVLGSVAGAAGADPQLGEVIGAVGDVAARGLQAYTDARAGG